jgi:hypothetical protein
MTSASVLTFLPAADGHTTNTAPTVDSQLTPAHNISARTTHKTPFFCCSAIVSEVTYLFARPLLSDGCCIAASFAVVA